MAVPALRQPKIVQERIKKFIDESVQNVILTLKGDRSLVIPSDAYHGIIKGREVYRCVFCSTDIELDAKLKELHIFSTNHRSTVENYPHVEDYSENLIRKLDKERFYCTICNVIVSSAFLSRHLSSEVHTEELEKAEIRATAYKPTI